MRLTGLPVQRRKQRGGKRIAETMAEKSRAATEERERVRLLKVQEAAKREATRLEAKRRESEASRLGREMVTLELVKALGNYSDSMLNDGKDSSGKWITSFSASGKAYVTRSYKIWGGIVQRSSPDGAFQKKFKHYIGTTVCDEWKNDFQAFADWYTTQPGYAEGWDVDKDVISGSKHYSPATCVLLPRSVNLMFAERWYSTEPAYVPLNAAPRWRTRDQQYFYDKGAAYSHAKQLKLNYINEAREKYEPIGLPKMVLDKAELLIA
jgi:hypothetical protein